MKILRLVIGSFGNQNNKVIDFSGDTNVIMGTDADTINTVESFLDGMLFGLSSENQKKYRPKRLPYSGIMVFENDEGEQIQINRNFLNDTFTATDIDGNDVTDDYVDEYGNLAILPTVDSVYAHEVIKIPDNTESDIKKIKELNTKKRVLEQRYNIEAMNQELEALKAKLDTQKQLEQELDYNNEVISQNEKKVQAITGNLENRENEINQQILNLKNEAGKIELEIGKLKEENNKSGSGKAQVLKRDIHNNEQYLELVNEKITNLEDEEKLYENKLNELKDSFNIDRGELKADFNEYQDALERINKQKEEDPLVSKLVGLSTWFYAVLIIISTAAIAYVLYNPGDTLNKAPIYLISFLAVFIALSSIVIIYLQFQTPAVTPQPAVVGAPITSNMDRIIKKYHQENTQDFEEFFNDAKKIYIRIDNLEADLHDIRTELADAKEEKKQLEDSQHNMNIDLHRNRTAYENTNNDEKIFELTKERNKINAQIDELVEERQDLQENSIWKLKEESFILNEKNQELMLQDNSKEIKELQSKYDKLKRRISHYNEKVENIDSQIEKYQSSITGSRRKYVNSYATPGEQDYDMRLAEQFSFGLQNNLAQHNDIPYVTSNPFQNSGELTEDLIDKFKQFIENNQTLIFITDYDDLDTLRSNKIKYNGIFIR